MILHNNHLSSHQTCLNVLPGPFLFITTNLHPATEAASLTLMPGMMKKWVWPLPVFAAVVRRLTVPRRVHLFSAVDALLSNTSKSYI